MECVLYFVLGATPELRNYLINDLSFVYFAFKNVKPATKEASPDISFLYPIIKPGDVVFYWEEGQPNWSHVALVIGWGPPTTYRDDKEPPLCSDESPANETPGLGQLPWIVDHSGPGFKRAYNDTVVAQVEIDFVHIPDSLVWLPTITK